MNDLKDIQELYEMCGDESFDRERASELILSVDINKTVRYFYKDNIKVFLGDAQETKADTMIFGDTFLVEAAESLNYSMCKLLLENGADPNYIDSDYYIESMMDTLWFPVRDREDLNSDAVNKQLRIARLMLEYGANPNPYDEDNECLMEWIVFDLFNEDTGYDMDYHRGLLVLMVAYGASCDYCKPEILKPFDKSNMDQYEFYFVEAGEGRYSGIITDGDGETVARI